MDLGPVVDLGARNPKQITSRPGARNPKLHYQHKLASRTGVPKEEKIISVPITSFLLRATPVPSARGWDGRQRVGGRGSSDRRFATIEGKQETKYV